MLEELKKELKEMGSQLGRELTEEETARVRSKGKILDRIGNE